MVLEYNQLDCLDNKLDFLRIDLYNSLSSTINVRNDNKYFALNIIYLITLLIICSKPWYMYI